MINELNSKFTFAGQHQLLTRQKYGAIERRQQTRVRTPVNNQDSVSSPACSIVYCRFGYFLLNTFRGLSVFFGEQVWALRADGFCSLCFVLLARSIAKLTGFVSDQSLRYFPTSGTISGFAIGIRRQRTPMDDALCRIHG